MHLNRFTLILLLIGATFFSCTDPLGITDFFCNAISGCYNGTGALIDSKCVCLCNSGFCGKSCEYPEAACQGKLSRIGSLCVCKCPELGVLKFEPPECSKVVIPLVPNPSVTRYYYSNPALSQLSDPDYFPLYRGNSWTYDVIDSSGNTANQFALIISRTFSSGEISPSRTSNEDTTFIVVDLAYPDSMGMIIDTMPGPLMFDLPSDPNQIHVLGDTSSGLFLFHNYTIGDTLILDEESGEQTIVDSIGQVIVPADTFRNCIAVWDIDSTGLILCKDVGMVANVEAGEMTTVLSAYELSCNVSVSIEPINLTCHGSNDGAFDIFVLGDTTGLSFVWNGPSPITDVQNPDNLSAGFYSVSIRTDNCMAFLDSIPIIEPDSITIQIESIQHPMCSGDSTGIISVNVTGGVGPVEYFWDNGITASSDSISNLPAACYTLEVVDSIGCSKTISIEIVEQDPISISPDTDHVACFGHANGSISLDVIGGTPGYSYNWNSGQSTEQIQSLEPGTYTVTVTDQNNCTTEISVSIQQPDSLSLNLSSTDAQGDMANGQASVIVVGGTAPYSFQWNDENMQTTETAVNLVTGSYTVIVTDSNGCTSEGSIVVGMVTSIDDEELSGSIKIYPIPAVNYLKLDASNFQGTIYNISIIDRKAKTINVPLDLERINLEEYSSGVYFIRLVTSRGILTREIIKI